jgi:uncharacterized protein with FMN-binding domain
MRRAVPAVIITLVGLGALASFQSTPGSPAGKSVAALAVPRATTPATTAPPPTDSTAPDFSPPTTAPSPATTPTPATTPPAPATANRTLTGDAVDTRYGIVQVQVTVQGNTITDISALQLPDSHQRSVEISQQAEPLLRQEALQAQSAQIDIISGATFTSEGYAQSLQSALDKAHG